MLVASGIGAAGVTASGGAASIALSGGVTVAIDAAGVAAVGATSLVGAGAIYSTGNGNAGKGDSDSKKNKIPDNDSTTGHIFRDAEGHIPDTPENRALLEDVANDPANFRGTDKYGNEWYTKIQSDGSQVWVESREMEIFLKVELIIHRNRGIQKQA